MVSSTANLEIPRGNFNTDKPSLAWRKDVRDKFDSKKDDIEKDIEQVMGEKYTLSPDVPGIWSYCKEGWSKSSPGNMLTEIYNGALYMLRNFASQHGDHGKQAVNKAAFHHVITLEPSEDIRYGGCDFKDGKLRILFNPNENFAGADKGLEDIHKELAKASPAGNKGGSSLPFDTTSNINQKYDANIPAVIKKIQELLKTDNVTFVPNFEQNFADVVAAQGAGRWTNSFGRDTYDYFYSLSLNMDRLGLGKDDMLQEAYQEAVSSGKIELRTVPALKTKADYVECVAEGGVLYIQTLAKNWAVRNEHAGNDLLDAL